MSNEEKYMSWLPNGLNNFWYKEFDEILDDYSKSKDQQIKDLMMIIESFDNLILHIESAFNDGIDLTGGLTLSDAWIKYNITKQLYQRKYLTK